MGKISEALQKLERERRQVLEQGQLIEDVIAPVENPLSREETADEARFPAAANSEIDQRVISYHNPSSVIAEEYRILRTNILSNNSTKQVKSINIVSPFHGEGKTVTAANLAVTMSFNLDKRVLLMDCDLRGGAIHKLMGINAPFGLSDVLSGKTALEAALCGSAIDNLTVLPRGNFQPNPSELISSRKMARILEELKFKFDHIILDSPPVIPFADATVLSSIVDGSIIVVQAYRTQARMVRQAEALLQHVHAKILGLVLTQAEHSLPKGMSKYFSPAEKDSAGERENS